MENESMETEYMEAEPEVDSCDYYKWTYEDLASTCITSWWTQSNLLRCYSIPAKWKQIPPQVVNYLKHGPMTLPKDVESSGTAAANLTREESLDDDWDNESESDPEESKLVVEKDEEFDNWISETIKVLEGEVFSKVNWNSAQDARWVAFNKSLKCYVPGDIYLLLKCSSHIGDVIDNSLYRECPSFDGHYPSFPLNLVLRLWVNISPGAEFRCFVIRGRLVGISQRLTCTSFDSIKNDRDNIIKDIHQFFVMIRKEIKLSHYVMDLARFHRNILLVDLNVFGLVTSPCLFSYRGLKMIYDQMLIQTSNGAPNGAGDGLEQPERYGNPVFKYIHKSQMLTYRPDLHAAPSTV